MANDIRPRRYGISVGEQRTLSILRHGRDVVDDYRYQSTRGKLVLKGDLGAVQSIIACHRTAGEFWLSQNRRRRQM
jgi:hypothetical protein